MVNSFFETDSQKMPGVLAANLVEVLASLSAAGFALVLGLQMYMMKMWALRRRFREISDDATFLDYEDGWYFFVAWFGACFTFALMFPLLFQEIYESMDMIDSATTVLSFLMIYLMMMLFWVVVQYVISKRGYTTNGYAYTFIFLSICCAVVVTVLVFATLHENPWYHYLVVIFYVPPIFAIFATNSSSTYKSLRPIDQPKSPMFSPLPGGSVPMAFTVSND